MYTFKLTTIITIVDKNLSGLVVNERSLPGNQQGREQYTYQVFDGRTHKRNRKNSTN